MVVSPPPIQNSSCRGPESDQVCSGGKGLNPLVVNARALHGCYLGKKTHVHKVPGMDLI